MKVLRKWAMLVVRDVFARQARVERVEIAQAGSRVMDFLAIMTESQRRPGVVVRTVALPQQFCSDPLEVVGSVIELGELLLQLLAFVGADRFVVVACDLDVVLPELSLTVGDRRDFLELEEYVSHQVNAQHVCQRHAQADAAQSQQLESLILRVIFVFDERFESLTILALLLEDRVHQ